MTLDVRFYAFVMSGTPLVNNGKSLSPFKKYFCHPSNQHKHIFLKYAYTLSCFYPIFFRKGITLLDIDDPWRSQRYMALCYSASHQLTDQTRGSAKTYRRPIEDQCTISNPPHPENHKLEGEWKVNRIVSYWIATLAFLIKQHWLPRRIRDRLLYTLLSAWYRINIGWLAFSEL